MMLQHLYDLAKRAEAIAESPTREGMIPLFKILATELDKLDVDDFPPDVRVQFLEARSKAHEWAAKASFGHSDKEAKAAALIANVVQRYPDKVSVEQSDSPAPTVVARHVVIVLHGIRTHATWQKRLAEDLTVAGFVPVPLDYGKYFAIAMAAPASRRGKVDWFLEQYTTVKDRHPGATISVIAHSFGTYMVANAIRFYPQVKFDRVIFCGAIVEPKYPWEEVIDKAQVHAVLNEFGGRDFWAGVVANFVADAGPSGRTGFETSDSRVQQRPYPGFHHSDYFHPEHYRETWVRFLKAESLGPLAISETISTNIRFRRNCRIFILLLVLGAVCLAAWRLHHAQAADRDQRQSIVLPSERIAETFSPTAAWRDLQAIEFKANHKLVVSNGIFADQIRIAWSPVPNAMSYEVIRYDPDGRPKSLGSYVAAETECSDIADAISNPLRPFVQYRYNLRVYKAKGDGQWAPDGQDKVGTIGPPTAPAH